MRVRRREERRRSTEAAYAERPSAEPPQLDPLPAGPLASSCADQAAEKVRRAGGPRDEAVYTCCCGYLFSAPVSTTVSCPHCGTGQAW